MQCAVRRKADFQKHFTFELQIAGFLGVHRIGFESDLDWSCSRTCISLGDLRSSRTRDLRGAEPTGLNAGAVATAVAFSGSGDAATEVRTGHCAPDPLCSAGTISLSGAGGHVKGSERSGVELRALLAGAGRSVRIAEAAGLNFLNRSVHGRSLRTASCGEISGVNELRTRATRHLDLRRSELIHNHFWSFKWLRCFVSNFIFGHHELGLLEHWQLHRRQKPWLA